MLDKILHKTKTWAAYFWTLASTTTTPLTTAKDVRKRKPGK